MTLFILVRRRLLFGKFELFGLLTDVGLRGGDERLGGIGGVLGLDAETDADVDSDVDVAGDVLRLSLLGTRVGAWIDLGECTIRISSAGELSRLGGGELNPVFERGDESMFNPSRRLCGRSFSDTADGAMLDIDEDRCNAGTCSRAGVGVVGASLNARGTETRVAPRFTPRIEPDAGDD